MNPKAAFLSAGGTFVDLVHRIDGDWDRPGLDRWTLRELVGHTNRALITVTEYLAEAATRSERAAADLPSAADYYWLTRQQPDSDESIYQRGVRSGVELGPDPYATVQQAQAAARDAVLGAKGDPVVPTRFGGLVLSQYLQTRTFELVAHSYDIAAATGLEVSFVPAARRDAEETAIAINERTGWTRDF